MKTVVISKQLTAFFFHRLKSVQFNHIYDSDCLYRGKNTNLL